MGRWRSLVPVVIVVAAGVLVATVLLLRDDRVAPDGESEPAVTTSLLAVDASGPEYASLEELVAASELVVRGRVLATNRGRMVGSADAAVESRLVTVEVDDVLLGETPAATIVVEEEGWLSDGTPIAVNGLAPSAPGLDAIWFLTPIPDPDLPAYLVVNHQGRYAVDTAGTLTGADADDPLIARIEGLSADDLAAAVRAG